MGKVPNGFFEGFMEFMMVGKIGEPVFFQELFFIEKMLHRIIRKKVQAFLEFFPAFPFLAGFQQPVYRVKKLFVLSINQLAAG